MIFKFLEKNILACAPSCQWYSSITTANAAKKLNKLSQKNLLPIFTDIKKQNFSSLINLFPENELKLLCGKKATTNSTIVNAELAFSKFDFKTCEDLLEKISPLTKANKARVLVIKSGLALNDGDLESASLQINSAIRIFKKLNMQAEEAQAYLLCGIIYKACAMNDTAQIMLETAAELFADIGANAKYAEAWGNLGMLMVQQNRYSDAEDYFNKALNVFTKVNDICSMVDIYNQLAIMKLIEKEYKKAKKFIDCATTILPPKYIKGKALNLDISAQIANANNQWKKVIKLAKLSAELYLKEKNFSAYLEMLHLQAHALIVNKQFVMAEDILRKIIKISKSHQTCFHIANAYNLLGNIYMQKGDFFRAKTLFNQALSAELYNDRWCGAAIDYANIAITEYRKGEHSAAEKNKSEALKLAKESGDEELLQLLENRLSAF